MAKCTNGAKMKHFLTLDVESVGLLGEGFAWATVLTDATGKRIEERYCLGSYVDALGSHADLQWVKANVLPALGTMEEVQAVHLPSPRAARLAFLEAWAETKKRFPETVLVADCPFPVEAHFLIQAWLKGQGLCTWVIGREDDELSHGIGFASSLTSDEMPS